MKTIKLIFPLFLLLFVGPVSAQLKSVIYDFEGLDAGKTDLPDGGYFVFDMAADIVANPLGKSPMLGYNVLKLNMNWKQGKATFGKTVSKFIELNASTDYLNFYLYNPASNTGSLKLDVTITEDDDKDNTWEILNDDKWRRSIIIDRSSSWQLISLPLNSFIDFNAGGDGIFDPAFTNHAGKIFNIEFSFYRNSSTEIYSTAYIDMVCFSEGLLPTGNTILNTPPPNVTDHCYLGASLETRPQDTPALIEGLFPPDSSKKLKYVNSFIGFSDDRTTVANKLPGEDIARLLLKGYTPMISWEPMYLHLPDLDPAQPTLTEFIDGKFDSYINAFADKLKSYNDTIIIRFMHEFEANWYPWSLVYNNEDPILFKTVFRKVVDQVRARGATKVKWLWCPNGISYYPVSPYNWIIDSYPGDAYVDIVGCEAYNVSIEGIPYWRSFRSSFAEPYYYLRKYMPNKPLFICENGCRERYPSENPSSQTKAQWIEQMDKELQSNFHEVDALIFFSVHKSQDYRLNSSLEALNSYRTHFWNDDYYFKVPKIPCEATIKPEGAASFCSGEIITLHANQGAGFSYQWRKNGLDIPAATASSYTVSSSGDYQVRISFAGCTDWSSPTKVTVNTILTAKIFPSGPTTFCTGGSVILYANTCKDYSYQWRKNGVNIPGASSHLYQATLAGNYQVKIIQGASVIWSAMLTVNVNDCPLVDSTITQIESPNVDEHLFNDAFHLKVYPNPFTGMFSFDFCLEDISEEMMEIKVINPTGQTVYSQAPVRVTGCIKETVDLEKNLPTGIYFLQIKFGNKIENTKIILNGSK